MRIVAATVSVLICAGLFGCDRGQNAVAPLPAQVAAVPCNCQQPLAQPPSMAPVDTSYAQPSRRHGHRHHYEAQDEYSESSASSGSSESYSSSEESSEQHEYSDENTEGESESAVWVDGYGRSHYMEGGSPDEDDRSGEHDGRETGKRLDPWHGYNSKCGHRRD